MCEWKGLGMGVIRHEIVIFDATEYGDRASKTEAAVEALKAEMPEEFRQLVIGPVKTRTNGYIWYAMLPDGSKEFWSTSDEANKWREKFKALATYGAHHFAFGDEGDEVTDHSWSAAPEPSLGPPFTQ